MMLKEIRKFFSESQGDAYRNERSVILREEEEGGREMVMIDG